MTSETKKKKILFLITKSNWGGAQRYVYDIATHLDQNEFEVVVALGGNGPLKELLEHSHIKVTSIPSLERDISIKKELLAFWDIFKIIRREKPDVLHTNSSKAGGLGAIAGRLARAKKIIFTAHGWAFNEDRPWWQKIISKCAHYVIIALSHITVVVASGTLKQMNWPGIQNKMVVIHPGRTIGAMYNKAEARMEIVKKRPSYRLDTHKTWLGTIAELHPVKRHDLAIHAFSKITEEFPNTHYLIIGEGQEREPLAALIKTLNLEKKVFLLGSIQEAARFLKAFDFFLLASRSEAYAYVLTEAGLAHVPVIASDVGGIGDTISHQKNGLLFEAGSVTECANALRTLLKNADLRETYSNTLYKTVATRSVEKMTDELSVLYRKR